MGATSEGISVKLKLGKILFFKDGTIPLKGITNQDHKSSTSHDATVHKHVSNAFGELKKGCDGERERKVTICWRTNPRDGSQCSPGCSTT